MPPSQATPFAELQRLLAPDARPDEVLLQKFCADRDQAEFAVIVRRHGGLVLDVCRTVLRNEADAEDCFQATFVALAADAKRIRNPAALAGWLHAVAFRTAGKARRGRDRRRAREARVTPRPHVPAPDPTWVEVRLAIHEEVNRLPDRYRDAVVLFYLAGLTQDEVGCSLGLSPAGAKKRLERGRDLLRSALDRRGFGTAAVLAAATIALPTPTAALATGAAELAICFLTNRGTVPVAILSLLSGGGRPMTTKIVFGAAVLLAAATTVGLGVIHGGTPDQPAPHADTLVAAQANQPGDAGEPEEAPQVPPTAGSNESPKKASPQSRLATELTRFRALTPADRLKLIEKVGGADAPFTAAKRSDLVATVVERGSVQAANNVDVICKVKAKGREGAAATTIKWLIEEGSLVKKGDRIGLLDDSGVREQAQVAMVKVRETEAAIVRAAEHARLIQRDGEIEVRLAEIDVRLVEIEAKDAPAGKVEQVLALKVEQAKLKLERVQSRAKSQLVQAQAEIRAREAARDLETRTLRDLEGELQNCILMAPSDGLVVYPVPASGRLGPAAALIAPGEPVREGQKLLRVADLKQLVLETRIHESVISTIRRDQPTRVLIDAFPNNPMRGKVKQVSPVASASDWMSAGIKVYSVTIAIEDAPPGLKPGMTGQVHIETGERKAVLQVPRKAIVGTGKDRLCFLKVGQELLERPVVTGEGNATSVEIKEGLKEGDLVVADPPALLVRP